tara:strand:+ start:21 stop:182 length:162 start_codon:yes stop_codon:yes gene_type:complete
VDIDNESGSGPTQILQTITSEMVPMDELNVEIIYDGGSFLCIKVEGKEYSDPS